MATVHAYAATEQDGQFAPFEYDRTSTSKRRRGAPPPRVYTEGQALARGLERRRKQKHPQGS
jgi:hypothetical protein